MLLLMTLCLLVADAMQHPRAVRGPASFFAVSRIYESGDCSGEPVMLESTRVVCTLGPVQGCSAHSAGSVKVDCQTTYPPTPLNYGDVQAYTADTNCQSPIQSGRILRLDTCVPLTSTQSIRATTPPAQLNVTTYFGSTTCASGSLSWISYGVGGCILSQNAIAGVVRPATTPPSTTSTQTTTSASTTAPTTADPNAPTTTVDPNATTAAPTSAAPTTAGSTTTVDPNATTTTAAPTTASGTGGPVTPTTTPSQASAVSAVTALLVGALVASVAF